MKTVETFKEFSWNAIPSSICLSGSKTPIEKFKAIVRDDTKQVLNISNAKYRIYDNIEFSNLAKTIGEITKCSDVTFQELKGGKIVLAYLKNDDKKMKIGDFKIQDFMVLGNAFNGQYGLFLGSSQIIIRCSNAFGRIFQGVKIRHTNKMEVKIDVLKETINQYMIEKQKMFTTMEKFMKIPIDQKIIDDCTNYVFKLKEQEKLEKELSTRTLNKIALLNLSIGVETKAVGNTLWGLFSGFTHFSTHSITQKKNNSIGNLFGNVNDVNQRAYSFAESLTV